MLSYTLTPVYRHVLLLQVLFEQFKFFLNFYFLVMACSQFIPEIRVGYLYTTWGPLVGDMSTVNTHHAPHTIPHTTHHAPHTTHHTPHTTHHIPHNILLIYTTHHTPHTTHHTPHTTHHNTPHNTQHTTHHHTQHTTHNTQNTNTTHTTPNNTHHTPHTTTHNTSDCS